MVKNWDGREGGEEEGKEVGKEVGGGRKEEMKKGVQHSGGIWGMESKMHRKKQKEAQVGERKGREKEVIILCKPESRDRRRVWKPVLKEQGSVLG